MKKRNKPLYIEGKHHKLPIDQKDKLAMKLGMLFEAINIDVKKSINKYGYTEQRYYQILKAYKQKGTDGIIDKKTGPKTKHIRTDTINNQIIRHRFLDPAASPSVITQKLNQSGYKISESSVARTIAEYGLQKKTSINLILKRKKRQ